MRDSCFGKGFLLGGIGVVEEVGDDGVEDEEAWCGLFGERESGLMVLSCFAVLWERTFSYNIGFDERRPGTAHESQLVHACGHWGTAVVHNANNTALLPPRLAIGLHPGRSTGAGLRTSGRVGVDQHVFAGVEQRLDVHVLYIEGHCLGGVGERIGRIGAGMRNRDGLVPGVVEVWLSLIHI